MSGVQEPLFPGIVVGHDGKRREHDYYATPRWCLDAVVPLIKHRLGDRPRRFILEPGCGHGALAVPLARELGYSVFGLDIRQEAVDEVNQAARTYGLAPESLAAERGDLLAAGELDGEPGVWLDGRQLWSRAPGACIGNPPVVDAQAFVEACLRFVSPVGGFVCFLLPLSFLATNGRAAFWRANPADILVLDDRPSFTGGNGAFAEYGWYLWPALGAHGQIFRVGAEP